MLIGVNQKRVLIIYDEPSPQLDILRTDKSLRFTLMFDYLLIVLGALVIVGSLAVVFQISGQTIFVRDNLLHGISEYTLSETDLSTDISLDSDENGRSYRSQKEQKPWN